MDNLELAREKVTYYEKLLDDALKDEKDQIKIKIELLRADINNCDDPTKAKQLEAELIKIKSELEMAEINEKIRCLKTDIKTSNDPTKDKDLNMFLRMAQVELIIDEYTVKDAFSERFSKIVKHCGVELTPEFDELLKSNDQPYIDYVYKYIGNLEGCGKYCYVDVPTEYDQLRKYIKNNINDDEVRKKLLGYLHREHCLGFEVVVY